MMCYLHMIRSVLTDIKEIINAQSTTIVQQPLQLDQQMTPSDHPSSQTNVQLLQPEKKRRKINGRSTTSPVPEQERGKNKYYCDTCWRGYTRRYDLEDHKKKRCGKIEEKGEHKCEKCGEHFVKHNSLHEHVARVHDRKHPYQCTKCGENFWSATLHLQGTKKHNILEKCSLRKSGRP